MKKLEYVKEYYGYSNEKAKTALSILTKEQIETIKKSCKRVGEKNDNRHIKVVARKYARGNNQAT